LKKLIVNKQDLKSNIKKIKQYAPKLDDGQEYTIIGIVKGNGYGFRISSIFKNFN